jgi:diacylglycerol kinase (ATP)
MAIALPSRPCVLVIFNPNAGQVDLRSQLQRIADTWNQTGWQVTLQPTQYAGHATEIAREASEAGIDLVIAAGGDGTVNEIINGLVGSRTAMGTLPVGTVNIWAREMGLSMDLFSAAKDLRAGVIEQVDVGQAGDRYFLLMAGIGFDAAVTADVRSSEKKRLGAIAYVKRAIELMGKFQGQRSWILIDGQRVRGRVLMIVIGNSQLYGGAIKFTANAVLDDGWLDVCVIKGRSIWMAAPSRLLSVLTRGYHRDPKVVYYRAKSVRITGKRPLPVQVDGDFLGMTPMQFQVVPGKLSVLIPPGCDRSLWASGVVPQLKGKVTTNSEP